MQQEWELIHCTFLKLKDFAFAGLVLCIGLPKASPVG